MSHELRTPLNAIGGYAELLQLGVRGSVTPEQRADLERIQKSQRHLLGLINGVLNYAKVDAGAAHYNMGAVELAEVLVTCEALVVPQVRAKGHAFDPGACDPALRVHADREKVQQILLNLLSNAVKFTDPGGRIAIAVIAPPTDARCPSRSPTRAMGSRPICRSASSSRSCRPMPRSPARSMAPAWGWPSAATSPGRWAAT
jgi:signal transduction histidine kinase